MRNLVPTLEVTAATPPLGLVGRELRKSWGPGWSRWPQPCYPLGAQVSAEPPGSRNAEWLRPELSRTAQAGAGCTPEADVVGNICGAQSLPGPPVTTALRAPPPAPPQASPCHRLATLRQAAGTLPWRPGARSWRCPAQPGRLIGGCQLRGDLSGKGLAREGI